jgi:hydrogenase 3 maturation protease
MSDENGYGERLKAWLFSARKVVVVGVGNTMRRDDAVGVEVVKLLRGRVSPKVMLVEAETMPEDYLDEIVDFRPSHVLIVDSGLIGKKPGDTKLLPPSEAMKTPAVSSHVLPLQVFCAYIEKTVRAKVLLLAIQPKSTDMEEGLTKEIAETAEEIADFLAKILPELTSVEPEPKKDDAKAKFAKA